MKATYWMAVLLAAALIGCGEATVEIGDKDDVLGANEQREAWSAADAPALFNQNLEFKLDALPLEGQAQNIPWAGSYWPVYEDSINVKWDGETSESAAAKYGKAFNVADVENKVSKAHGIDAHSTRTECTEAAQCKSELGETCAKRRGADKGRCIPTWWGICHAWGPASILVPEPKREVTRNGVTFKVNDLKALVTLVHNRTSSKFVSLRCNKNNSTGEVAFDNYGRPAEGNAECRDTNAGTYHVLLANYLGVMKQSFVEDRTFDHEVWNQPLRSYRVVEKREVSMAEANKLVGATTVGGTTTAKSGTVAKSAWVHQDAVTVTSGQPVKVMMTGTGDADLFVKFGAQPTAEQFDCRPYAGGSTESCELTAPVNQTQLFVSVNGYADTSNFSLNITVGGAEPTTYVFNAKAKKFVFISSEVQYIGESASSQDGNLSLSIDQYTKTDHYQYILELDADGKIIGGEWVGESLKAHPDFLWLPTGHSGASVAGGAITYANVKSLLDESVQVAGAQPGGDKTVEENGTVAKNELKVFGPFRVAEASQLQAILSGTGDADLYVRKGQRPTMAAYDCRPYKSGSSETCSVVGPGEIYVGVNGYAATSTFKLVIKYREGGAVTPPVEPPAAPSNLNVEGNVAQGEMKLFTLPVAAGRKLKIATTSASDIDLYVQLGAAPTTSAYLKRGYTSSGNETVEITVTSNTTLYLGVHGYAAGAFELVTSDL